MALTASITVSHLSEKDWTRERNFLREWDCGPVLLSFRAYDASQEPRDQWSIQTDSISSWDLVSGRKMRKLHTAPQMSPGIIRVSRNKLVAPFLPMFLNTESAIEIIWMYFFSGGSTIQKKNLPVRLIAQNKFSIDWYILKIWWSYSNRSISKVLNRISHGEMDIESSAKMFISYLF